MKQGALAVVHLGAASTAFLLVFAVSCGGSKEGCVPGQSISCSLGSCTGHQVCDADGEAYGECLCSDTNDGDFPATGPHSGLIGAACDSSADCRSGFECLTADSTLVNGEGPSAGICLARCLPDHDFCSDLDARSKCIVLSDGGTPTIALDDVAYCLPGCEIGTQPNEVDKCRSRIDLVCAESPAGSAVGFCRPACRSDLDCGRRHCDLSTGLCGDTARSGDPIGSACAPGPTASSCGGACLDHGATFAECSGVCSYGTAGCGQQSSDGPLDYFCTIDPTVGSGAGDLGYCAKLCDCDDDCGRSDAVCEPSDALPADAGHSGVCGSKTYTSGERRPNTPC